MEPHDPYRAPARSVAQEGPTAPVDMSAVAFNSGDGKVASAATIAAGYTSSIIAARWLATIIDFIVLFLVAGAPLIFLEESIAQKVVWLSLAFLVAYFPVMETVWGGAVGKLATGTRVVNVRGERPAWWQSIIRTLLRLIEVNPFLVGGVPAGIVALMSGNRQRLADMLPGTYVRRRADTARTRRPDAPRSEPVMRSAAAPATPSPPPLPGADDSRWARQARE